MAPSTEYLKRSHSRGIAIFSYPGGGARGRGRSRKTWEQCVQDDIKLLAWFAAKILTYMWLYSYYWLAIRLSYCILQVTIGLT